MEPKTPKLSFETPDLPVVMSRTRSMAAKSGSVGPFFSSSCSRGWGCRASTIRFCGTPTSFKPKHFMVNKVLGIFFGDEFHAFVVVEFVEEFASAFSWRSWVG